MKRKITSLLMLAIAAVGLAHASVESGFDAYVLKTVQPEYPERMLQRGESGQVLLKVIVSEDGKLAETKVISATNRDFGSSALQAVKNWKFEAAQKEGKSVAQVVVVPVRFQFGEDLPVNELVAAK
ncbi:energy transducer TonB [Puniceicoccaceae bacterium K14]|nr:energy transducer TonB [Puniceicoccaceae bacterium K14]